MATRFDVTQSGTFLISNGATPLVQVQRLTGQNGQLTPLMDIAPQAASVGGATQLVPIGFRTRGTPLVYQANWPILYNGEYECTTGGLPLWVTVVVNAGSTITLFVQDTGPVTASPTTVALSTGLVLDALPPEWDDSFEVAIALQDAGTVAGTWVGS